MKKSITKRLLSLTTLFLIVFYAYCQEETEPNTAMPEMYTQYVYADAGVTLGVITGINYEKLYSLDSGNTRSFVVGGGYDFTLWYGPYVNILYNYCIRKDEKILEFGGGVHLLAVANDFTQLLPIPDLHVNLIYQKSNSHLIYKTGFGIPKGLTVGVGYAF